jgi:hypothetical protein
MRFVMDVTDELRTAAEAYIAANKRNVYDIAQDEFEGSIQQDDVIDFVGVVVYMLQGQCVAWYDDENMHGYRAV